MKLKLKTENSIPHLQYDGYTLHPAYAACAMCPKINKVTLESDIYSMKDASCGLDDYVYMSTFDQTRYIAICISLGRFDQPSKIKRKIEEYVLKPETKNYIVHLGAISNVPMDILVSDHVDITIKSH